MGFCISKEGIAFSDFYKGEARSPCKEQHVEVPPLKFFSRGLHLPHIFLWTSACEVDGNTPTSFFVKQRADLVVMGFLEGRDRTLVDLSSAILQNRTEREANSLESAPTETILKILQTCSQPVNEKALGPGRPELSVMLLVQTVTDFHIACMGDCRAILGKLNRHPGCAEELAYVDLAEDTQDLTEKSQHTNMASDQSRPCPQEPNSQQQSPSLATEQSDLALPTKVDDKAGILKHRCNRTDTSSDLFLVLGSNALWQAMPPQDTVAFVQTHRRQSIKNSELVPPKFPSERTTSISHLLCGEAYTRQHRASIPNDGSISCLIVEFSWTSPLSFLNLTR